MMASELIEALQAAIDEHEDHPVAVKEQQNFNEVASSGIALICLPNATPKQVTGSPPMKQYHEPIQVEVGDDGLPYSFR